MNHYQLSEILAKSSWRWAKAKANPHAYTLRKNWEDDKLFQEVVQYIRDHGYPVKFWGKPYTILNINGYRYWTMGCPINLKGKPHTILINKAAESYQHEYCDISKNYDDLFDEDCHKDEEIELMAKLELSGRVLDIGCGTGLVLDYKDINPEDYVGVDISQGMLDCLKEKHPDFKESAMLSSFEDFYDNSGFDTIISLFGSISYIEPAHIKRIRELLRGGGSAFLMFYKESYKPVTHLKTGLHPRVFGHTFKGEEFHEYTIVRIDK